MAALNALMIAGTDTEVGKTVLTSALAAYWQKFLSSRSLGLLKPVQAGVGDRELYQRLFLPDQPLEAITPQYFSAPLAPPLAAALEGRSLDLTAVWQTLERLCQERDWVLVESLGGLGSPVTEELAVADLAAAWHLPVVLVVPVQLGAIAQAVANVALARQCQVNLRGIVLNCCQPRSPEDVAQWAPAELITRLTQVPILGTLPYLDDPEDLEKLSAVGSSLQLEALGLLL
ncbi:dethiobiotin synthase [Pseudanabaena sp. FACHB-2040]|uniref:dethiobiotin synthase n=1 Tax=Pseudanabaena sp. FACHB-2040 TaxID=2692859 RepID=UPI0016882328|nr:dethiobiotin synthase [Pseudanabaena sp. FACHB-2040]MBD2257584.1 ATP-dependent dethiobiotin synthetase BioD [Pseudanabaena sp. FACHB-2040]